MIEKQLFKVFVIVGCILLLDGARIDNRFAIDHTSFVYDDFSIGVLVKGAFRTTFQLLCFLRKQSQLHLATSFLTSFQKNL